MRLNIPEHISFGSQTLLELTIVYTNNVILDPLFLNFVFLVILL